MLEKANLQIMKKKSIKQENILQTIPNGKHKGGEGNDWVMNEMCHLLMFLGPANKVCQIFHLGECECTFKLSDDVVMDSPDCLCPNSVCLLSLLV